MTVYYSTGEDIRWRALALSGHLAPMIRSGCGKPRLLGGCACISLTHTEGLFAIAVGKQEVGLDAEKRRDRKTDAVRARLSPPEREEDFFSLWTAKEAYIKYRGGTLGTMYRNLLFQKGVLYEKGEPIPAHLAFFTLEGCTLCLCTRREEACTLIPL